jgi:hypothetical protein
MLDRPLLDKSRAPARAWIAGVPLHDLVLLWRLAWRIAVRQPRAFRHFWRALYRCARENPRALSYVGILVALFLHFGPFSRFVIAELDRQIARIDAGEGHQPDIAGCGPSPPAWSRNREAGHIRQQLRRFRTMVQASGREDS